MKYKLYLETAYNESNGNLEEDMIIECSSPELLDCDLKEYCEYLYNERDGYDWMRGSDERIVAVDENGEVFLFYFELEYEPSFWLSEARH